MIARAVLQSWLRRRTLSCYYGLRRESRVQEGLGVVHSEVVDGGRRMLGGSLALLRTANVILTLRKQHCGLF